MREKQLHRRILSVLALLFGCCAVRTQAVTILVDEGVSPRVNFAVGRLCDALESVGPASNVVTGTSIPAERPVIVVGHSKQSGAVQSLIKAGTITATEAEQPGESFLLKSCATDVTAVVGGDDSGVLYGCLELAERIRAAGGIPGALDFSDGPAFVLRGPCIGMQRPDWTYDRMAYDFPYTMERFPFFYDKKHWRKYLDSLLEDRMNTLYLWNGHPFPSLLRLEKYPDAQEVSDEQLARNIEMFTWLTTEADKRGIWVIQMFYNIHISHPLARKHNLPYHHDKPTKFTSDYTRYCISEFVRNYPNVGLLVCLGEALKGHQNQIDWLTKTIIPGVRDGMNSLGSEREPPIVIRAHAVAEPKEKVLEAGLEIYRNLYTMAKYNGESLTTWRPRGRWAKIHRQWSSLGSSHMVNVHLLANLDPFRWGSPDFIRKCVLASRDVLGAQGVQLYPLAYWNWPWTGDNTEPRLTQADRDWIWFAAWARYAWNPDRDPAAERRYWTGRLAEMYGSRIAGEEILDAYEDSGECAPRILRRFGITGGVRQTMSQGMRMTQLINPKRFRPWRDLWESDSPPGERLDEYLDRRQKKLPHEGETPPQVIDEILYYSAGAVAAVEAASPHVTKNREEFERLKNDMHCIRAMTKSYADKVRAAMLVLEYEHSGDISDLERALPLMEQSLEEYRRLTDLTDKTYLYSMSWHAFGRKIPFASGLGRYIHWRQCLPEYEKELADFRRHLAELKDGKTAPVTSRAEADIAPLPAAQFELLTKNAHVYEVKENARAFWRKDISYDYEIQQLAGELKGLKGIAFWHHHARTTGVVIEFEVSEPVKVLVGYVEDDSPEWLKPPAIEEDVGAATKEGFEPVIRNAVILSKVNAPINVHVLSFPAGRCSLDLGRGGIHDFRCRQRLGPNQTADRPPHKDRA